MKKSILLTFMVTSIFLLGNSCSDGGSQSSTGAEGQRSDRSKGNAPKVTAISSPEANAKYALGEKVDLKLAVKDSAAVIDSVKIYVDGSFVESMASPPFEYTLETAKLGTGRKRVTLSAYYDGDKRESNDVMVELFSDTAPTKYTYRVIREYPHDKKAFIQGLVFENGYFYEGTGQKGSSYLRKVDMNNGKVVQQIGLDQQYFGEGITILGDEIFQITWKSHTGFVYDKNTFEKKREFQYGTEGWGLTTDGKHLIMSDGTNQVYFMDPGSFAEVRRIQVYTDKGPIQKINELEYINGEIYANTLETDHIIRIDPETGKVLGIINFENIMDTTGLGEQAVLNGVAYDSQNNRIFVTGKLWPKLFEVQIVAVQ